jgi:hypothetical protein
MANMLSQTPKQSNPKFETQIGTLADLKKRQKDLEVSIERIESYVSRNQGDLQNSPLYRIKIDQLKSVDAKIKGLESTQLIGVETSEKSDTSEFGKKSLDDVIQASADNNDLFDSAEFADLIKNLPGEYVEDKSNK